mmetsp:Transcript_25613/g.52142  ORF Transcript_25613/g.52142 Transcript_25613/m.52142 type:complete len:82 (-) Transcript_25613:32-277(-)
MRPCSKHYTSLSCMPETLSKNVPDYFFVQQGKTFDPLSLQKLCSCPANGDGQDSRAQGTSLPGEHQKRAAKLPVKQLCFVA